MANTGHIVGLANVYLLVNQINMAYDYSSELTAKVLVVFFISNCGGISLPAGFFPTTSVSPQCLENIFDAISTPLKQFNFDLIIFFWSTWSPFLHQEIC